MRQTLGRGKVIPRSAEGCEYATVVRCVCGKAHDPAQASIAVGENLLLRPRSAFNGCGKPQPETSPVAPVVRPGTVGRAREALHPGGRAVIRARHILSL